MPFSRARARAKAASHVLGRRATKGTARRHHLFQPQGLEKARVKSRIQGLPFLQGQLSQGQAPRLLGHPDGRAHGFVGRAERHAFAHQVVGGVGGFQEAFFAGRQHALRVGRQVGRQDRHHAHALVDQVKGLEEELFVLLLVAVVAERLALLQGQQVGQQAVSAARPAPQQLGHVRVALLRHQAAARGDGVAQLEKAELLAAVEHDLFAEAGEVLHDHGQGVGEVDDVVAVADAIDGILGGSA